MSAPDAEGYVTLGAVGGPYGVRGWVKLISYADPPDNILDYREFRLRTPRGLEVIEVDSSRAHGKGFVAHIKGCDDRDVTRHYTGGELLVPRESLPALGEDEYYWYQLEGLTVVNRRGEELGRVERMMETGANDVVVVSLSAALRGDGQSELLIPYVRGQVVKRIDLDAQLMEVDWEADY